MTYEEPVSIQPTHVASMKIRLAEQTWKQLFAICQP